VLCQSHILPSAPELTEILYHRKKEFTSLHLALLCFKKAVSQQGRPLSRRGKICANIIRNVAIDGRFPFGHSMSSYSPERGSGRCSSRCAGRTWSAANRECRRPIRKGRGGPSQLCRATPATCMVLAAHTWVRPADVERESNVVAFFGWERAWRRSRMSQSYYSGKKRRQKSLPISLPKTLPTTPK
jgi:hypothetical protein